MNKKLLMLLMLFLILPFTNCKNESPSEPGGQIIGAICKDGTSSTATGAGACSSHGGVDHWLYR